MRSALVLLGVLTAACSAGTSDSGERDAECAHVVGAEAVGGAGTYTFHVTVSSSETGWDKYADAWEVVAPDGAVLGTRTLLHPHVEEQPFTRSLTGVEVPEGVDSVTIRARDSVLGFCGDVFELDL